MQTPSTLQIWVSEQAVPLALLVALVVVFFAVLYGSARMRQSRMKAARAGMNEDTFIRSLLERGLDAEIGRVTFRYLRDRREIAFPIRPFDKLDEDLGLDLSEIDESLMEILHLTGRLHRPGLQHQPLITVEDLVRLVQASPRRGVRAA